MACEVAVDEVEETPAAAGGDGGDDQADDASAATVKPEVEWPGIESLPPGPPTEWGEAKEIPPPDPPFDWDDLLKLEPPDPPNRWDVPLPDAPPNPPPVPEPALPSTRRWPWAFVGIAVLATLVVAGASVIAVTHRDDRTAATPTTPTTAARSTRTTGPSSTNTRPSTTGPTTTTTAPGTDEPLRAAMIEVGEFVSSFRGRPFLAPVAGVRLEGDAFATRMRKRFNATAIAQDASWLVLLGLLEAEDVQNYAAHYIDQQVTTTRAYYDNVAKELVLRGTPGSPVEDPVKAVLAHELTHAYDDQHFPFDRPQVRDPATEVSFGMDAAVEGDAMGVAEAWARQHGLRNDPRSGRGVYDDVADTLQTARYDFGAPLLATARAAGGEAAVDQLLADPLTTSEQVMHLLKYKSGEPERPVDRPPAEGESHEGGPVGELMTRQVLQTVMGPFPAQQAAEGWGGDRTVTWVRPPAAGGLTCRRTRYVMDTPGDLDDLERAFALWVTKGKERTVVREGDHLDVTVCARVPPPRTID